MADRKSWETFETISHAPYWEAEYSALFAPECELEAPNAPPGMPQHFCAVERPIHFDWLARTTKAWRFSEVEPYGAPEDSDIFWLMRTGTCLASWGGQKEQPFSSRFLVKTTIREGLVRAVKELFDPFSFLRAAGREVPIFPMVLDPEAVERERPLIEAKRKAVFVCNDSDEVCQARKQRALEALRYHRTDPAYEDAMPEAPNIDGAFFFAPPGMDEDCTPHRQPGHLDWLSKCEVDSGYSSNEFPVYATGDPDVYFDETCYHGLLHWPGNPPGRYRNTYMDRIVFDHGYIKEFSEFLNPINKFNSINVSVPSFPYYFD